VTIPEDLCEELARVIGYDQVPATVVAGRVPRWNPQPELDLREKVRDALVAAGLQETISYTATTADGEARIPLGETSPPHMRLQNPVSADFAVLRRTLREGILRSYSANARTWRGPVALFEVGRVFLDHGEGLPQEREMIVGVLGGPLSEAHWAAEQGRLDFFDAKGAVEAVLEALQTDATFAPVADATMAPGKAAAVTALPSSHPGRETGARPWRARVRVEGLRLGIVGEVSQEVLAAFDIASGPVAMFELDLEALRTAMGPGKAPGGRYRPFGRFPASPRDLALVLDDSAPAGDVIRLIGRNKLVAAATVFDVYRGKGVPAGKKSLAIRVIYKAADRTLTSDEVDSAEKAVLFALSKQFGAERRA
jgi:phenylalanyl-tRNA synthetase beta chain